MASSPLWRLLPLKRGKPAENMAIDETILEARRHNLVPNTLRFYQWQPSTASIGRNQSIKDEIDVEFAKKNNIAVIRRISGGGAVFHDTQGELTYSIVIGDIPRINAEETYNYLSSGIQRGLSKLGLKVTFDKIHCPSLFVQGRKISGNAQARRGNTLLQHGTILINYNPELMYKVLRVPPGKTQKGIIRSVFQHVTTISRELEIKATIKTVYQAMVEGFTETLERNLIEGTLIEWEQQKIQELLMNKYNSDKWIFKK
ncbi:MAG: biotin/lipoate A/B protein ligase family protein [Promethearchaeota archaeon]